MNETLNIGRVLILHETVYGDISINLFGINSHMNKFESSVGYLMSVAKMPKEMFSDTTAFFKDRIDNYMNTNPQVLKELLDQHWITYKGRIGVEAHIKEVEADITSSLRWIINDDYIYILSVGSKSGKENNPDIDKFFNSLNFKD